MMKLKKQLRGFVANLKDSIKTFYYYKELPSFHLFKKDGFGHNADCRCDDQTEKSPIVIISNHLPRYDQSSADLRLLNILNIFESLNRFKLHYVYVKSTALDAKYKKAMSHSIECHQVDPETGAFKKCIEAVGPEYIWITSLWQIAFFELITKLVQQLDPYKIILDTVDFHAKEYQRKYNATKDIKAQKLADEFMALESKLYPLADSLVVVSKDEKQDILKEIDNVKEMRVLPNIHHVAKRFRPLSKRNHMCFLGNFGNTHNIDTVKYFVEKIFPFVLEKIPSIEFHVLGNLGEKLRGEFKHPNVRVIGRINDINKAMSHYRLFVCPMRFGAGLKGKVGLAMETGLPTVTTQIGAEGFPVEDGRHCFIVEDPKAFSQRCIQLLTDDNLWHAMSTQAAQMVDTQFGVKTAKTTIETIFTLK